MTDLSPETNAFLAELRGNDGPSHDDRRRIRERLMLQLGAAAFTTGAASTSAAMTNTLPEAVQPASLPAPAALPQAAAVKLAGAKLSLAAKFALSAAVLGGLGALAANSLQKPVSVAPVAPAAVVTHAAPVEEPAVVQPVVAVVEQPAQPARKPRARAAEHSAGSIAEEIALLSRAQSALRGGRTSEARALSREHAARFPAGSMRHERLGIDAMARCADGEDGAGAAAEFMRVASGSPLASAVRKACKLP